MEDDKVTHIVELSYFSFYVFIVILFYSRLHHRRTKMKMDDTHEEDLSFETFQMLCHHRVSVGLQTTCQPNVFQPLPEHFALVSKLDCLLFASVCACDWVRCSYRQLTETKQLFSTPGRYLLAIRIIQM